jgi:hypothetical protein
MTVVRGTASLPPPRGPLNRIASQEQSIAIAGIAAGEYVAIVSGLRPVVLKDSKPRARFDQSLRRRPIYGWFVVLAF